MIKAWVRFFIVLAIAGCGEGRLTLGSDDQSLWDDAPPNQKTPTDSSSLRLLRFDEEQLITQGYVRYTGGDHDRQITDGAHYYFETIYVPVDPARPVLARTYASTDSYDSDAEHLVCSALWEFSVTAESQPLVRVGEAPRALERVGLIPECLVFRANPRRFVLSDDRSTLSFSPRGQASPVYRAHRDSLAVLSSWTPLTGDPLPALAAPKGAWTGERVLIYGLDAGSRTFRLGSFDPVKGTWVTPEHGEPGKFSGGYDAVLAGGRLVVTEGFKGSIYDPKTNSWSGLPLESAPFVDEGIGRVPRVASGDGKLFVILSTLFADPMRTRQSFGMMDLASGEWQSVASMPEITDHLIEGVVWTGKDLVLWFRSLGTSPSAFSGRMEAGSRFLRLVTIAGSGSRRSATSSLHSEMERLCSMISSEVSGAGSMASSRAWLAAGLTPGPGF